MQAAMKADSSDEMDKFARSGYGSHHLLLVNAFAQCWNKYISCQAIDPSW
jgi:ppGpp synthetase/RelA/SpoT-type nucleotidyltranferase